MTKSCVTTLLSVLVVRTPWNNDQKEGQGGNKLWQQVMSSYLGHQWRNCVCVHLPLLILSLGELIFVPKAGEWWWRLSVCWSLQLVLQKEYVSLETSRGWSLQSFNYVLAIIQLRPCSHSVLAVIQLRPCSHSTTSLQSYHPLHPCSLYFWIRIFVSKKTMEPDDKFHDFFILWV